MGGLNSFGAWEEEGMFETKLVNYIPRYALRL